MDRREALCAKEENRSIRNLLENVKHHTFLSKRFDRTASGERIHFASGITLLQRRDGDAINPMQVTSNWLSF